MLAEPRGRRCRAAGCDRLSSIGVLARRLRSACRHLLGHLQLCQVGVLHALLELFRESTLKGTGLHFVEDSLFLQEIVESGTGAGLLLAMLPLFHGLIKKTQRTPNGSRIISFPATANTVRAIRFPSEVRTFQTAPRILKTCRFSSIR